MTLAHPISTQGILPLSLQDVSYEIGGMRLIKNMNLQLEAGSLTVIMGPNGSGKSLLLRLCHGLLEPSNGKIVWQGEGGGNPQPHQAMVFQRPIMLRRSVIANLTHGLKHRGVSRTERNKMAEEMLNKAGLKRLAKVPARRLSFGEQQRLAVARAWLVKPEVLFMDEPTAALDADAREKFENRIHVWHSESTSGHGDSKAFLWTSHDPTQVDRMTRCTITMHRGELALPTVPGSQQQPLRKIKGHANDQQLESSDD